MNTQLIWCAGLSLLRAPLHLEKYRRWKSQFDLTRYSWYVCVATEGTYQPTKATRELHIGKFTHPQRLLIRLFRVRNFEFDQCHCQHFIHWRKLFYRSVHSLYWDDGINVFLNKFTAFLGRNFHDLRHRCHSFLKCK